MKNSASLFINYSNDTKFKIDANQIIESFTKFLENKKIFNKVEIGLSFVKENDIKKINNKFRKINQITDVLSFPIFKSIRSIVKNDSLINLGDIIVCPQYTLDQTILKSQNWENLPVSEQNHLFTQEIIFLSVHGLKHLIGIHHK
jgi:probable rRNA maturation factor